MENNRSILTEANGGGVNTITVNTVTLTAIDDPT